MQNTLLVPRSNDNLDYHVQQMLNLLRAETQLTQPHRLCYTGPLKRASRAIESSWIWVWRRGGFPEAAGLKDNS